MAVWSLVIQLGLNMRASDQISGHYPLIRHIVKEVSQDQGLVDDISQECCVRLIEKENLWSGRPGSYKGWMSRVVRNLTRTLGRKESRRRAKQEELPEEIATEDSQLFSREQISFVMSRLKGLSTMQMKILHLKYFFL